MLPGRNLKSYIARIKKTSLPEIAYRINQAITVQMMRVGVHAWKKAAKVPSLDEVIIDRLQMPSLILEADSSVISLVMDGEVFRLNGDRDALARFEATWSEAYFADISLDPNGPDIREVWEPARLQHLAILLLYVHQNTHLPRLETFKAFIRDALFDWVRRNPFLTGLHYMSPMECGLRIPVFFYALRVLDNMSTDDRREIITTLYLHAWWVQRNLSLYSSRGNHTICECIGLIFGGAIFRDFNTGQRWLRTGINLLIQEAYHQILDDGGPVEQSLYYHRFVLDLYWVAVDFLERNNLADLSDLRKRLIKGEEFLRSFEDGSGNIPSIGDSDDGFAVAPGVVPVRGERRWAHA